MHDRLKGDKAGNIDSYDNSNSSRGFRWIFTLRLKEIANRQVLKGQDDIGMILYHSIFQWCAVDQQLCLKFWRYLQEHAEQVLFILDGYDEVADEASVPCETLVNLRYKYIGLTS